MQSTPPARVGAGVANNNSSAPANGTDPAVEADLEKAMRRFAERGPPAGPARGPPYYSAQYPPRDSASGTSHTAPPASTSENGRKLAQTSNGNTTSSQKKKNRN